ncbi:MAG: undecaprenyl-diphosphate phosphatase [Cyclobacteriaceae bacterium]|nr:undecaprenyl-diphosphate phosphatase [Cyclobacteriaceae bacterium]
MSIIDAIILGLLQGLTEFLPVSSSGHLELGSVFLGIAGKDNLLFSVLVHGATALSTILVFRKDIFTLIRDLFQFKLNESTLYVLKLALSMVPVGIVGLLWESEIEAFFGGKVIFVSAMLMITALLLTLSHFVSTNSNQAKDVSFFRAVVIGIAQAFALLPGVSRSGATISTALLLGTDKTKAARFSFLMVLAPITGATLLKVKDLIDSPLTSNGTGSLPFIAGFLAAFISGVIACKWMIRIVKKGQLIYFAIYCFVLASIVMFNYW